MRRSKRRSGAANYGRQLPFTVDHGCAVSIEFRRCPDCFPDFPSHPDTHLKFFCTVKFTHARILSLSAALLCISAAVHAVRPTPAFRSADSKIIVTTPAPAASQGLNQFQRERLAVRGASNLAFAPGSPDTLRVAVFQVQFTDTLPMTATGKVLRRELRSLG